MKETWMGLIPVLCLIFLGGLAGQNSTDAEQPPIPLPSMRFTIKEAMPLLGAMQSVAHSADVSLWVDPDLFYSCTYQAERGEEMGEHVCETMPQHAVAIDFVGSVEDAFRILAMQTGGAEVTTEWREGGWSIFVHPAPPSGH